RCRIELGGEAFVGLSHGSAELRERRSLPARDVAVLSIVALDEDAFARPTADQRRLRTVRRHVAAASADERDHGVDRTGAAESHLPLLRASIEVVSVQSFCCFDTNRVVILSHWGFSIGAGCSDATSPLNCC